MLVYELNRNGKCVDLCMFYYFFSLYFFSGSLKAIGIVMRLGVNREMSLLIVACVTRKNIFFSCLPEYIYIYIYIYRERERDTHTEVETETDRQRKLKKKTNNIGLQKDEFFFFIMFIESFCSGNFRFGEEGIGEGMEKADKWHPFLPWKTKDGAIDYSRGE